MVELYYFQSGSVLQRIDLHARLAGLRVYVPDISVMKTMTVRIRRTNVTAEQVSLFHVITDFF